ncbi:MAG: DUF4157 domain-containing protein, partial [Myxococcales bacterium]|nr:DUF4157 domain-containing protein [Myxococcales bacterium]
MPGHGRRVTAVKEGDRATSTGAPKVDRAGERASASNRAMGRLLRVGSEHADAEHLAERLAGAAFRRIRDDTAPAPQLGVGPRPEGKRTGSDVSPVVAEGIGRLRGGGQRLDAAARGPLEQAYGRGLGHVREHRGPNVDPIAAALGARAFTLGHDVFVRSDQPRAETAAGLSLYAHEVAHTFEGAGDTIRRTKFDSTLARYYSSTLEGQRITDTQGVITATANEAIGGGHNTMYLESLKAGTIDDWRVDLRVGGAGSFASSVDPSGKGSSVAKSTGEGLGGTTGSGALSSGSQEKISGSTGSGSGMVGKMEIRIFKASASNLKDLKAATKKRSFVTTRTGIEAALAKATDIKDHLSDYAYRLMGRSFIGRKKSLNCARFGQKMLKAAGVDAADASAGSWLKLPSTLAKGADVGHVVDPDWE